MQKRRLTNVDVCEAWGVHGLGREAAGAGLAGSPGTSLAGDGRQRGGKPRSQRHSLDTRHVPRKCRPLLT